MNKVIIVTIDGCQRCQKLKESFKNSQILHTQVKCEDDPGMCDELESYTKTMMYPMVIIKDTNKINYIFFIGNSYNYLGKELDAGKNLILCPQFSIEDIIEKSKEKLKQLQ